VLQASVALKALPARWDPSALPVQLVLKALLVPKVP
jgi:hypothetical protein